MLFALTLLLGWSCQKDQEQLTPVDPVPEAELSFVVPVDEALQTLEVALDRIDGEVTRAGNRRMVKSIERVKAARALRGGTRTMGDQPALEDLFYIVSFGEGQGSAVLGADRRLESIYAILDETVLTAEDFNPPASTRSTLPTDDDSIRFVASEEELTDFITGMIVNAAFPDRPTIPDPGVPEVPRQRLEISVDTVKNIYVAPTVKTKWGQGAPYNLCAPVIPKTFGRMHYKAGCTSIAIAQWLLALRIPGTNMINGSFFSWYKLSRCEHGKVMDGSDSLYVATYVKAILDSVDPIYTEEATYAFLSDYTDELADAYVFANQVQFSDSVAETRIIDHGAICMAGWPESGDGHAWVLDGVNTLIVYEITRIINDETGLIISETRSPRGSNYNLFHCNYGWRGHCDGYYIYSMFNVDSGPTNGYDESIGDRWGTDQYSYLYDLEMLDYIF